MAVYVKCSLVRMEGENTVDWELYGNAWYNILRKTTAIDINNRTMTKNTFLSLSKVSN
jgi:hypothetical protein